MLENLKKFLPDPVIKEEDLEKYKRARGLYIEDPWERVKSIFSQDDFGNLHPELVRTIQAAQLGFCIGGGIGAVKESFRQSKEFLRTNDTNIYLSKNEMYRKISNNSFLAMGKGAFKWGPKIGLFVGGFTLVAACCEAYRNKSGIIEYIVGGYIAGGVSKSAFGFKGFISGGIIGSLLGLFCGTIRVGLEKLTKTDTLTLRYSQYAYRKHKIELLEKMRGSSKTDATDTLIVGLYGEHTNDPLNALDGTDSNSETNAEK